MILMLVAGAHRRLLLPAILRPRQEPLTVTAAVGATRLHTESIEALCEFCVGSFQTTESTEKSLLRREGGAIPLPPNLKSTQLR